MGDHVLPTSIDGQGHSVNRSDHSEPEDVLIGKSGHGIAAIAVRDVPREPVLTGPTSRELRVDHVPEPKNYAHSEIRIYKDGEHEKRAKRPGGKEARQVLKARLSEKFRIHTAP